MRIIGLMSLLILLTALTVVSFVTSYLWLLAIAGVILAYRVGVTRERDRQQIRRAGHALRQEQAADINWRTSDTRKDVSPKPEGPEWNEVPVPHWAREPGTDPFTPTRVTDDTAIHAAPNKRNRGSRET
jgi:hypothetical protein